ncbi:MAG: hypothetical protein ONB49_09125, partial [candidate division KSB1 bacterium]|nr:hypothetical protein [candidate division KSB1 bacterium]
MKTELKTNLGAKLLLRHQLRQRPHALGGVRDRLFHKQVTSGLRRQNGRGEVQGSRIGDESRQRPPFQRLLACSPTPDYDCYPETGHTLGYGFREFWKARGGLATFGYPISEEFWEGGYVVQYFERARFELHPKLGPNVVLLGLLGRERYLPPVGEMEWLLDFCPPDKRSPMPVSGTIWGYRAFCPEYGFDTSI